MARSDAAPTPARLRERRLGGVTTTSRAKLTGDCAWGETSTPRCLRSGRLEGLGDLAPLLRREHGARARERPSYVVARRSHERPEARERDRGIGPGARLLHHRLHRVG